MNRVLKIGFMLLIFAFFCFSCKHDQGGNSKVLMLYSFKVGNSEYNRAEKKISITKVSLRESDLKEVVFKDGNGNVVSGVNFRMEPPDGVRPNPEAKFSIEVSNPPSGYTYKSEEITVVRELASPKVLSITCQGEPADLNTNPYTVSIKKPTVIAPSVGPDGKVYGDIRITFDKTTINESLVQWEGLPVGNATNPKLEPEGVAHVTIRIPEKPGEYKAGEYHLDIKFETPSLSIKTLSINEQDGDTDLKELKVNVKHEKTSVVASDVNVTFTGDYIDPTELSSITPIYEGLPLNNLEVSKPVTFKVKVNGKPNKYKPFEATITVERANVALKLTKISIFGEEKNINTTPFTHTVETMKTFLKVGDIKATFEKADHSTIDVDCSLKGGEGDKVYLKAGVDNEITFYVPPAPEYAEYRNKVIIKHDAKWEQMVEIPMPDGGVTFKSGNKDDVDKKIDRKIAVAQFPVTYKLFKEVCEWAKGSEGQAKGYKNFDVIEKAAQNGAKWKGRAKDKNGNEFDVYESFPKDDFSEMRPLTSISYHAAIAWCNAYSEKNGYAPAYYKAESGKIDMEWGSHGTPDYHRYTSFTPTINVSGTKEEVSALALRDALGKHHPNDYDATLWPIIRDNYYKVAILTAKQAKFDDDEKSGFRLIDTDEWEFVGRLRKTKNNNCTDSSMSYNSETYYFANKDCAPGSEGYGNEGSEIEKVAWVSGNSAVNGKLQTHPIGHKIPTDLGIYDLAGNVGSWTNTWSKSNGSSGNGVADFDLYSVGGGFSDPAGRCTVNTATPSQDGRFDQCGIRLCRTLK
ncbi:MAG: SUMF1/EgtB/PvdO family nonheme iron enzyme [Treponema sp.]